MGKTYKDYPRSYFRHPRGYKQAVIADARKRSVPPTAWDDYYCDRQCRTPWIVAKKMLLAGLSAEKAAHKIVRKFKVSYVRAMDIVMWHEKRLRVDGHRYKEL